MIRHCGQAYPRSGVPPARRTGGTPECAAAEDPRRPGVAAGPTALEEASEAGRTDRCGLVGRRTEGLMGRSGTWVAEEVRRAQRGEPPRGGFPPAQMLRAADPVTSASPAPARSTPTQPGPLRGGVLRSSRIRPRRSIPPRRSIRPRRGIPVVLAQISGWQQSGPCAGDHLMCLTGTARRWPVTPRRVPARCVRGARRDAGPGGTRGRG